MAALGSLVVSLEANTAKFTAGMDKAAYQTEKSMRQMKKDAEMVGRAIGAMSVVAAGALVVMVKNSIDAADNLRDMSMKTGIAVSQLNGLAFAAGQAGGNLESMVASAGKLNKSIAEAAGGNKDIGAAFSALGINVLDASGNLKKADVVIAEVADKFSKYQDGPEKAAIALRLFGKSGADMIPLLNEGGDALRENTAYAKQYANQTDELSAASDNFNDTMGKLSLQQKGFGNAMTTAVLPILQAVADETLTAAEQSDKFALATNIVRTVLETMVVVGSEVAFVFKGVGTEIGGIAAQLAALAHGDIKGFNAISEAMKADAELAAKEHDKFIAKVLDRTPAAVTPDGRPSDPKPKPNAPRLPGTGTAGEIAAAAKKQMDGQLKNMENALAQERDVLQFHDQYVSELRSQDLIDLATYEDYRKRSIDAGLASSIRAYDAEIAALEAYKAKTEKGKDQQEAQNKIDDITAKKEKAHQDASQKSAMLTLDLAKAQNELNKEMKEWVIQQDVSASQFQFEIDMMGKSTLEVAKLTAAKRIQLDVEERIRQAQKNSSTPIDRAQFDKDAATAIAKSNALYDQADSKQKDPWFNMQESVRKYSEEASNSGAQIGNAMTNAFHSAEDAFVQFEMTGKGSFSDLARSILADLARIQAQKAISGLVNMAIGAVGSYFGGDTAMRGDEMSRLNIQASAAGGFDVPSGVNPVTQLHEREMVLPREQADVIRGMASGKSSGGSGGVNVSVTVDASGSSVEGDGQKANQLGAMIGNTVRSILVQEQMPGGILS